MGSTQTGHMKQQGIHFGSFFLLYTNAWTGWLVGIGLRLGFKVIGYIYRGKQKTDGLGWGGLTSLHMCISFCRLLFFLLHSYISLFVMFSNTA
ncbi:hypothetical protein V8F06_000029 [Rhypophila decipiens]